MLFRQRQEVVCLQTALHGMLPEDADPITEEDSIGLVGVRLEVECELFGSKRLEQLCLDLALPTYARFECCIIKPDCPPARLLGFVERRVGTGVPCFRRQFAIWSDCNADAGAKG